MGAQIIVGCDPHKLSFTLAAVDGLGQEIDVIRGTTTRPASPGCSSGWGTG